MESFVANRQHTTWIFSGIVSCWQVGYFCVINYLVFIILNRSVQPKLIFLTYLLLVYSINFKADGKITLPALIRAMSNIFERISFWFQVSYNFNRLFCACQWKSVFWWPNSMWSGKSEKLRCQLIHARLY